MGALAAYEWSACGEPAYAAKWAGPLHATQLGSMGGGVDGELSQRPVRVDCRLSYTTVQATIALFTRLWLVNVLKASQSTEGRSRCHTIEFNIQQSYNDGQ